MKLIGDLDLRPHHPIGNGRAKPRGSDGDTRPSKAMLCGTRLSRARQGKRDARELRVRGEHAMRGEGEIRHGFRRDWVE